MNWYDTIAEGYDELRGEEQRRKFAVFDDYISDDMTVLDVGFGTGLSDAYFDATIIGLEPSTGMLNEYDGDATTYNEEASNIPEIFGANVFDAALCVSTAHHFDNLDQGLKTIETAVTSDGYVFLSVFDDVADKANAILADKDVLERCHVDRDTVLVYQLD